MTTFVESPFNLVNVLAVVLIAGSNVCWAQVDEMDVIKQLEAAGGRVMNISAENEDKDVSLYLAGEAIQDEHVLLLRNISNIKWLNLANTAVTDAGLEGLAEMKLTKLHLEKTGIGDAGMVHLKDQKELEYLNLYATKVTDAGLEHLAGLKKLRKLYVWQSGVTEAGMAKLNEQLPELEIVGEVKVKSPVVEEKEGETKGEGK